MVYAYNLYYFVDANNLEEDLGHAYDVNMFLYDIEEQNNEIHLSYTYVYEYSTYKGFMILDKGLNGKYSIISDARERQETNINPYVHHIDDQTYLNLIGVLDDDVTVEVFTDSGVYSIKISDYKDDEISVDFATRDILYYSIIKNDESFTYGKGDDHSVKVVQGPKYVIFMTQIVIITFGLMFMSLLSKEKKKKCFRLNKLSI